MNGPPQLREYIFPRQSGLQYHLHTMIAPELTSGAFVIIVSVPPKHPILDLPESLP